MTFVLVHHSYNLLEAKGEVQKLVLFAPSELDHCLFNNPFIVLLMWEISVLLTGSCVVLHFQINNNYNKNFYLYWKKKMISEFNIKMLVWTGGQYIKYNLLLIQVKVKSKIKDC